MWIPTSHKSKSIQRVGAKQLLNDSNCQINWFQTSHQWLVKYVVCVSRRRKLFSVEEKKKKQEATYEGHSPYSDLYEQPNMNGLCLTWSLLTFHRKKKKKFARYVKVTFEKVWFTKCVEGIQQQINSSSCLPHAREQQWKNMAKINCTKAITIHFILSLSRMSPCLWVQVFATALLTFTSDYSNNVLYTDSLQTSWGDTADHNCLVLV